MLGKRAKISFAIVAVLLLFAAGFFFLFLRFVKVPSGAMANTIIVGDHLVIVPVFGQIERGDIIVFKYPPDPSIRYVKRVIGLPGERIELSDNKVIINGRELAEARVFVEYDPEAMPLKELSSEGAGSYRVYYYAEQEDGFGDSMEIEMSRMKFGRANQPFRIPMKGEPILEEIKNDAKLRLVYDADRDGFYDSDQYFCMGDNRDNSEDSRYWGTVPRGLVVGKFFMKY